MSWTHVFYLPFPPTVNTYWRKYRNIMVLSEQARKFKTIVKRIVNVTPMDCRLEMHITINARDRRKYDVDNRAKGILDSLNGVAYIDDEQIDKLTIERGGLVKNGACVVRLRPYHNDSQSQ